MTDCEKVLRNLYNLMEEDPSIQVCKALKKHLDACEACARYFKELTVVVELCRAFPEEPISEERKKKLESLPQEKTRKGPIKAFLGAG